MKKSILLLIILISISSAFACKEKECCVTKKYYSTENIYNIQEIVNNGGGISTASVSRMIEKSNQDINLTITYKLLLTELRSLDNQERIFKLQKRVYELERQNNAFNYYFNYIFKRLGVIE